MLNRDIDTISRAFTECISERVRALDAEWKAAQTAIFEKVLEEEEVKKFRKEALDLFGREWVDTGHLSRYGDCPRPTDNIANADQVKETLESMRDKLTSAGSPVSGNLFYGLAVKNGWDPASEPPSSQRSKLYFHVNNLRPLLTGVKVKVEVLAPAIYEATDAFKLMTSIDSVEEICRTFGMALTKVK